MRVLYISDPGIVGGATRSLIDVVSEMKKKDIECIVCTSSKNELNDELAEIGVESISIGHYAAMETKSNKRWKNGLRYIKYATLYYFFRNIAVKRIVNSLDINQIDLIHTNSARNDIGCILNKKYGIPHIMHIREFGEADFECWTFKPNYSSYLNRYTTRFIAISNAVKQYWIKKGINSELINVIYNGVNNVTISMANQIGEGEKIRMVVVGGICAAKGQLHVIQALSRINSEIVQNLSLDLIGWADEDYLNEIKKEIACKKLHNVNLLGAMKNIDKILADYDVGITSSRAEGFGRVTAEYMHAGLGVIVSDTGANKELIDNEKNGLIYKYGDVDDLAKCIERFYWDRRLLKTCARCAVKKAQAYFTREKNANNLVQEYYQTIGDCICEGKN